MDKQKVIFRDLGNMDYKTAWDYQESLLQENTRVKSGVRSRESIVNSTDSNFNNSELRTLNPELSTQHYLLFVEHPPVYTLG